MKTSQSLGAQEWSNLDLTCTDSNGNTWKPQFRAVIDPYSRMVNECEIRVLCDLHEHKQT